MNPVLPLPLLIPLVLVGLALLVLAQVRTTAGGAPRLRAALIALRLIGALVLAVALFNPGRWVSPPPPQREWAVLVDRSASMTTADTTDGPRFTAARRLEALALSFSQRPDSVRRHTFGGQLDADDSASVADAPASDATAALAELLESAEASRRPLAGVLLLGDGRQTRASDPAPAQLRARAMNTPVHALPLGGPVSHRDLSIQASRPHIAGLAGRELTLRASVRNRNLGAIRPEVRLLDAAGRAVASTVIDLADGEIRDVSLSVPAAAEGSTQLTWHITPPTPDDLPANDRSPVLVSALKGPVKILLVEGVPHWDTKFLAQLLRKHAAFALTTVHRLGPDRFYRIGGPGGEAGPGEAQPFPDTEEELFSHDLVILGRGAEFVLTPARTALLLRFLRDHGGGLLFARGQPGAADPPGLADLEPAEWAGEAPDTSAHWKPTPAGVEAGLFGGALPGVGDPGWAKLPPLAPQFRPRALRPFANALAVADSGGVTADPFLLTRRIGRGASATVNIREFWRWDFFPASEQSSAFYKRFWPELVQWLSLRGDFWPGQNVGLALESDTTPPGEPVTATLRLRLPAQGTPTLRVVPVDGPARVIQPQSSREPGTWTALVTSDTPGLLRLEAGLDGQTPAVAALRVSAPMGETDERSADPAFLKTLCTGTGGDLVDEAGLAALVRAWEGAPAGLSSAPAVFTPLWDRAAFLLLLAAAFGLEWFLRRRSGLA